MLFLRYDFSITMRIFFLRWQISIYFFLIYLFFIKKKIFPRIGPFNPMTGATDLNISVQWNSLSLCRSSTSTCIFHKSKLYLWSLPKSAALPGAPYQKSGPPCTQLHQPKPNSSLLLVHHEIPKPHGDNLPRISLSSTQHSQLPTHRLGETLSRPHLSWLRSLHLNSYFPSSLHKKVKVEVLVTPSCRTLCDPMDCM